MKNLSRALLLGLALAGWTTALLGDGWKLLPLSPKPTLPETSALSVGGVRLGDSEVRVRALWGDPVQTEPEPGETALPGEEFRYLRYADARMVVLQQDRVVVVDAYTASAGEQALPAAGDSLDRVKQTIGAEGSDSDTQIFSYPSLDGAAKLHYVLREGQVALVSLARTTPY